MKSRIFLPAILLAAATSVYAQPSGERDPDPSDDTADVDLGGPEAKLMLKIHLQNLVEADRHAVARPREGASRSHDREGHGGGSSAATRRGWCPRSANYAQNGIADHVEAPPYSVVEQDTLQRHPRPRPQPADRRLAVVRGRRAAPAHRIQHPRHAREHDGDRAPTTGTGTGSGTTCRPTRMRTTSRRTPSSRIKQPLVARPRQRRGRERAQGRPRGDRSDDQGAARRRGHVEGRDHLVLGARVLDVTRSTSGCNRSIWRRSRRS